jgi:CelD/BcsL family acetyltransferase involved in cellulose biosynthesis
VNVPVEIATEVPQFVRRRLGFWAERRRLELLPEVERAPQFPSFLAEACSALAADGGCFLTHLTVDDNPIASDLYFRVPGIDILYMRSFDPSWATGSPGYLLFAETVRRSSLENVRAVELGRGDEPYKRQIGGVTAELLDLMVTAD